MTYSSRSWIIAVLTLSTVLAGCATPPAAGDAVPAPPQARIPADIAVKLEGLSELKKAFILGDDVTRLIPTWDKLMQEFERRDAGQIDRFVGDMMAVIEAEKFQAGDMAEIPLNPESTSFNSFKVIKPEAVRKFRRDPGPFSVQRYVHPASGIPTFAGAPVALTPEDLLVGQVDVAIAGIPLNLSSGTRDSKNGPRALRAMHGIADRDLYSMVDPGQVLNIADYADIAYDYMSAERTMAHVREMVAGIARTGAIPMLVGGDHSLLWPTLTAITDVHGAGQVGLVHFGAHDNAARDPAHTISDLQSVYRVIDDGVVAGRDVIQVGLRGPQADESRFEWMRAQGIRYHTMAEVQKRGWDAVMQRVIDEAKSGPGKIYISFDVSVLDPTQLSAAGRATPGGLTIRETIPVIRRLCAETRVVGFELMDLAPIRDLSYVSTMNANYVLNACLSGIAMRKLGLGEADYLSPLSADHGQDPYYGD